MANPVFVDPFTGIPVIGSAPPQTPESLYAPIGDPSEYGSAAATNPTSFMYHAGPGAGRPPVGYDSTPAWTSRGGALGAAPGSGQYIPKTLYTEGDQWSIIRSQGENLGALQKALEDAGVLSGTYLKGQPDEKTADAMAQILASANASGLTWQEVLSSAVATGSGVQARQPLTVQLTSEDDIRAVIQSGAQKVFGKYLSEADIQKFVGAYQAQEAQAQQQAYAMAESGGTYTAPPSSSGGMNELFRRQFVADHTNEAGAAIFSSELDNILGALRGRQL